MPRLAKANEVFLYLDNFSYVHFFSSHPLIAGMKCLTKAICEMGCMGRWKYHARFFRRVFLISFFVFLFIASNKLVINLIHTCFSLTDK